MVMGTTEELPAALQDMKLTEAVKKTEKTVVKEREVAIEEQAAQTYEQLLPVWKRFVANSPKKALNRVVNAVFEFPLNEKSLKFQNGTEMQAFKIGSMLLDCKNIMVAEVMREKLKKEGDTNVRNEEQALGASGQSVEESGNGSSVDIATTSGESNTNGTSGGENSEGGSST